MVSSKWPLYPVTPTDHPPTPPTPPQAETLSTQSQAPRSEAATGPQNCELNPVTAATGLGGLWSGEDAFGGQALSPAAPLAAHQALAWLPKPGAICSLPSCALRNVAHRSAEPIPSPLLGTPLITGRTLHWALTVAALHCHQRPCPGPPSFPKNRRFLEIPQSDVFLPILQG